jgi:CheY-like chemotaxis protein
MIRISSTRHCAPAIPTRVFSHRLAGLRLLLAEDHPDHQRLFAMMLRHEGAEVEIVDNGRSAVQRAVEAYELDSPFDAIVMDLQMPAIDGYAATRALRRHGYDRPIVALSAHAMVGEREKCLDCGCTDYASKPVEREHLVGLLAGLVQRVQPTLAAVTSSACSQWAAMVP